MNIENKIKTSIEQEKLENELSHKKYELENLNEEKAKENRQLKDNWNNLKDYIRKKQDYYRYFKDNRYRNFLSEILDKMQELEQGSDSNE